MKKSNTIITDWLDKYGDPNIEKAVETKIFMDEIIRTIEETPNDMELGKKIRDWYNETQTNKIFESPDGGKTIYERTIGSDIVDRKLIKDGSKNEFKFKVGDRAYKPKGYKFPCTIVAIFQTTNGDVRIVGEMEDNGMLHIFNESQLEHNTVRHLSKDELIKKWEVVFGDMNTEKGFSNTFSVAATTLLSPDLKPIDENELNQDETDR